MLRGRRGLLPQESVPIAPLPVVEHLLESGQELTLTVNSGAFLRTKKT